MDTTDIDYNNKLVAFIDILGFRNYVQQPPDKIKHTIHVINDVLSHAINIVRTNNRENIFSIKLFSDCVCISSNLDNIQEFLYELAYIQCWFSMHGIFLRGALSKGLHYENDNIIFSQGLIKAYEHEQNAIYPRIVIERETIQMINSQSTTYVMKAPDRTSFVDYLNFIYEEGNSNAEDILALHKNSILNQVREHADNIRILEKYRWLTEYHNIKANEFIGNPGDWEDAYYQELKNKMVIPISQYFPSFRKPQNELKKKQLPQQGSIQQSNQGDGE